MQQRQEESYRCQRLMGMDESSKTNEMGDVLGSEKSDKKPKMLENECKKEE